MKWFAPHLVAILKAKVKDNGQEVRFEEIMAENFLKLNRFSLKVILSIITF